MMIGLENACPDQNNHRDSLHKRLRVHYVVFTSFAPTSGARRPQGSSDSDCLGLQAREPCCGHWRILQLELIRYEDDEGFVTG